MIGKFRNEDLTLLEIKLIGIYVFSSLILWYLLSYFFIYKANTRFYGANLILAIIVAVYTHKNIVACKNKEKIKLARRTISTFFNGLMSGNFIEIGLQVINHHSSTYLYTHILALFSLLTVVAFAVSLSILSFNRFVTKFDLKGDLSAYYVSIPSKLVFIVYFLFSSIIILFIINYISMREKSYIENIEKLTFNRIFKVYKDIISFNDSIYSDMSKYEGLLVNNIYKNNGIINRESIIADIHQNVNGIFQSQYNYVSININKDVLQRPLAYSINLFRERYAGDYRYSIRTLDHLTTHPFAGYDKVSTDVNINNERNIYLESYYPLTYFNQIIGYVVSEVDVKKYSEIIRNTALIRDWSYVFYKLDDKDIFLSSDNDKLTQNRNVLMQTSQDMYDFITDIEKNINFDIYSLSRQVDIGSDRYVILSLYIKEFNIMTLYYQNVVPLIKSGRLESQISIFISIVIFIFLLFTFLYITLIKILFASIRKANESTKKLIGGKGDLRNRIYYNNNDEIGVLINNFNLFLSDLDNLIGELKIENKNVFEEIKIIEQIIDDNTNRIVAQNKSISQNSLSINSIINSIQNVTTSIDQQKNAFNSASGAVEELLKTVYNINLSMERQASSVEQTSASIEEMIANIASVAKSVNKADLFAKKLLIDAHNGGASVKEVIEAIRGIEESSDQIKDIVTVIQNITDQTNLLAMNAAIEASHAGDMGKGFSVVADEIRTLSEDTAENAKSITNIIKNITKRVEETMELASNSGKSIDNILDISESTAKVVSEINIANSELEIGGRDILETIKHLNQITNEIKNSVKDQINSGDVVDSQITILNQINNEVAGIIEANSAGAKDIHNTMTFLNEISNKNTESNTKFLEATQKLNESFTRFNSLMEGFTTKANESNIVIDIKNEDNTDNNENITDNSDLTELERVEKELANIEAELKMAEKKRDEYKIIDFDDNTNEDDSVNNEHTN